MFPAGAGMNRKWCFIAGIVVHMFPAGAGMNRSCPYLGAGMNRGVSMFPAGAGMNRGRDAEA